MKEDHDGKEEVEEVYFSIFDIILCTLLAADIVIQLIRFFYGG